MARFQGRSRTDIEFERAVSAHSPWVALRAALFAFLALTFAVVAPLSSEAQMQRETLTLVTASGERKIDIEVARTPDEQAKGLMFRTELADTNGMLFPYSPPRELTMWMKNTYIPLDMVFIRPDGIVHRIEVRTEPLSEVVISSGAPAAAVLELAGGAAERLGIKPGDRVRHSHFSGK
jgi:uncharacterized protein